MLVLTRKLQEKITIACNITVTVLRVKGQTVRIGIEAPRDIRVVRGELPMQATAEGSSDAAQEAEQKTGANGSAAAVSSMDAKSRLPQRRKFERGSQAPLKQLVSSAV